MLFGTSPALATQWYYCFTEGYRNGCADETTLANLREHIAYEDDRIIGINAFTHHAYFGAIEWRDATVVSFTCWTSALDCWSNRWLAFCRSSMRACAAALWLSS